MRASHDFRFDASSPVGQHWLVHGVGFTVCDSDGETLGVVEDIDVDPLQHRAARVLVRRRGLFARPRYVAIDSDAVESVLPGPRLFFVAAQQGASTAQHTPHPTVTERVGGLARASRPPLAELDRRLAVAVAATLRSRGAERAASAEAIGSTAARARRETPRLAAWLSARALESARAAVEVLRFLAAGALIGAARLLADLAVVTAVLVAYAGRRAAAGMQQARTAARASCVRATGSGGIVPAQGCRLAARPGDEERDVDAPDRPPQTRRRPLRADYAPTLASLRTWLRHPSRTR